MQLSELFYSLSGEGPSVGRPAIFIRMSKCNRNCAGCDTKIKDRVEEIEPSAVISRVKNYLKVHPHSRVIFTGGEPLLQPDAINQIIDGLPGVPCDIETNGTLDSQIELFKRLNIIVVSPKKDMFKSSKEIDEFFRKWTLISEQGRHNVYFKLVIGNLPWAWNEREISTVISNCPSLTNRIWLMPAGDNAEKLSISARNCWRAVMHLGCNYSDRLHIRTNSK